MEQSERFTYKLKNLFQALTRLEESLKIDSNRLNSIEIDTVMNGQIQKFEICIELFWKTIQAYLREQHGVDTVSPKSTIKEFYRLSMVDEKVYESLLQMIDDRNRLSHIYNEMFFKEIHSRLNGYTLILNKVYKLIK